MSSKAIKGRTKSPRSDEQRTRKKAAKKITAKIRNKERKNSGEGGSPGLINCGVICLSRTRRGRPNRAPIGMPIASFSPIHLHVCELYFLHNGATILLFVRTTSKRTNCILDPR